MTQDNNISALGDYENVGQLQAAYKSGEREFSDCDFQDWNLRQTNLSYAKFKNTNFRRSDLSSCDLKGVDLSQAQLNYSNLQNSDLRGASLHEAILFMASLDDANLQGTDLSGISLDAATLDRANLQGADLSDAYLCTVDLSEVNLNGAYFNSGTKFDNNFDPLAAGMQKAVTIAVEDLLNHLNLLSQYSEHYLGRSLITKYWKNSRPEEEWLTQFQVDRNAQFTCARSSTQPITILQIRWIQRWINQFIGNCSHVFPELAKIADQNSLLVITETINQDTP